MTGIEMLEYKNWAVVGDVLNEKKFAFKIAAALEKNNYNIFRINPRSQIAGVYKSLQEIDEKIDVIDLVINPQIGLTIVQEALELGIDKIFLQAGADSEEIINLCKKEGLNFYKGCVLTELRRFSD